MRGRVLTTAATVLTTLVAAGCGSSGGGIVRPSSGTLPTTSAPTSTSAATSTSSAPVSASTTRPPSAAPTIVVTPDHDLRDGQSVRITGHGFSAFETLQVIECAQKGTSTGPGDCNLAGMLTATADAHGDVTATVTVLRGPFGANSVVCGPRQGCLVSVTQASLQPTEEADAPIRFAPR
ncbi:MAG: neocarzinostatin apoprotein domain-containing protein [Jatrophihabitans sp.]|uniref:neocarzinostatin apoprotein domain-containing protein n=1 Tax=Jatrophihabitans sp. TaxID=1932789 RepID=UPI003F804FFC